MYVMYICNTLTPHIKGKCSAANLMLLFAIGQHHNVSLFARAMTITMLPGKVVYLPLILYNICLILRFPLSFMGSHICISFIQRIVGSYSGLKKCFYDAGI